jgi:hypothetical protein
MDELADVRSIIDKNQEHPGILYAIKWLDLVLSGSATIKDAHTTSDDHLSRLYESGVTGYDVLLESAAVYRLYERGHPKRIHSHRHLLYMLGHRVCLLKAVARHQGITGRADRVIGTAINKKVGVLLRLISRALDDREEAQQRELSVLYEPLEL